MQNLYNNVGGRVFTNQTHKYIQNSNISNEFLS